MSPIFSDFFRSAFPSRRALSLLGILLFLSITLLFQGCFWGSSDDIAGGGAVASTVYYGRLSLRPMLFMPAEAQASVVKLRDQLAKDGYTATTKGDLVIWPENYAGGWVVQIGNSKALTDENGKFAITPSSGGEARVILRHPTDTRFSTAFNISILSTDPASPKNLFWPVPFKIDAMTPASSVQEPAPDLSPETIKSFAIRVDATPTKGTYGPRGSYPVQTALVCEDKNGPLGTVTNVHELQYIGSTCDAYVRAGACPNENFMSDIEYNLKLAMPTGILETLGSLFTGGNILTPPTVPTSVLACPDNHKGRVCQQVLIGDISVEIKGTVYTVGNTVKVAQAYNPGGSVEIQVYPGERVPLFVHNNGNFGVSQMEKLLNEIGGEPSRQPGCAMTGRSASSNTGTPAVRG